MKLQVVLTQYNVVCILQLLVPSALRLCWDFLRKENVWTMLM